MAVQLGPGGRGLLVLLGVGVIVLALGRGGILRLDILFESESTASAPVDLAPAHRYLLPPGGTSCEAPLLLALPPRAAALRVGAAEVRAVAHGAAALSRLARGEVEGAVASVAEIVAAWPLPEGVRIAAVLGAGNDLALVAAPGAAAAADGSLTIAAPAGSAEAFFAGAVPAATRREVKDAREGLQKLGAGRVRAAVVPRWLAGPAGPVGRPVELPVRAPIDPVVLVVGDRAACAGGDGVDPGLHAALEKAFGAAPAGLDDRPGTKGALVIAWAAARIEATGLPPLELAVTPALADAIWGGAPERRAGGARPASLPAQVAREAAAEASEPTTPVLEGN